MHKQHGGVIGLIGVRRVATVGSEGLLASGRGETVAALPPRLEFGRAAAKCG
jgi:hypothetical protein